jgi:hypothetical protein
MVHPTPAGGCPTRRSSLLGQASRFGSGTARNGEDLPRSDSTHLRADYPQTGPLHAAGRPLLAPAPTFANTTQRRSHRTAGVVHPCRNGSGVPATSATQVPPWETTTSGSRARRRRNTSGVRASRLRGGFEAKPSRHHPQVGVTAQRQRQRSPPRTETQPLGRRLFRQCHCLDGIDSFKQEKVARRGFLSLLGFGCGSELFSGVKMPPIPACRVRPPSAPLYAWCRHGHLDLPPLADRRQRPQHKHFHLRCGRPQPH